MAAMKSPVIVGVVMLTLGFAIGWVAKPASETGKSSASTVSSEKSASLTPPKSAPQAAVDSPTPGKRAIRPTEPPKPAPGMPTADQMDQAKQMQSQMANQMVERQRQKFETQIANLSENLSLNGDQKSKLTAWLDERLKGIESNDLTDPATSEKFMEEFEQLNDETLQAQLAGTLTPEQQAALDDYQKREHFGKIDAIALKNLSNLQGIMQFEDGQRDKVYELLTQSAEESFAAESKTPDIASMVTEGMGIEMDPYGLGIQQAMTEAMTEGIGDPTQLQGGEKQQNMVKTMRQIIADRIDAKVEKLRPVLNDKQLESYRNELQTKGLGVYGTVLDSMEKSASGKGDGDPMIVVPTN